jgi:hypothetical protein
LAGVSSSDRVLTDRTALFAGRVDGRVGSGFDPALKERIVFSK